MDLGRPIGIPIGRHSDPPRTLQSDRISDPFRIRVWLLGWRRHIQSLLVLVPSAPPLRLFQLLRRLAKEVCTKATGMTLDVGRLLSTPRPSLGAPLAQVAELLAGGRAEPPLVWFSQDALASAGPRLGDALRFGSLEVQEHLETFLDRRDAATECLNAVRTSVKLQLLGEGGAEVGGAGGLLADAGRALYKLLFQLVLLLEAVHKMVGSLTSAAKSCQLTDLSSEISALEIHLVGALDDGVGLTGCGGWSSSGGGDSSGTPTPTPSPAHSLQTESSGGESVGCEETEAALVDLIRDGKWTAALGMSRRFRSSLLGTDSPSMQYEDDISTILHVYCRHLARDKADMFVVTRSALEGSEILSRLMEALIQLLGVLNTMEPAPSSPAPRIQPDSSLLQRTEC